MQLQLLHYTRMANLKSEDISLAWFSPVAAKGNTIYVPVYPFSLGNSKCKPP